MNTALFNKGKFQEYLDWYINAVKYKVNMHHSLCGHKLCKILLSEEIEKESYYQNDNTIIIRITIPVFFSEEKASDFTQMFDYYPKEKKEPQPPIGKITKFYSKKYTIGIISEFRFSPDKADKLMVEITKNTFSIMNFVEGINKEIDEFNSKLDDEIKKMVEEKINNQRQIDYLFKYL